MYYQQQFDTYSPYTALTFAVPMTGIKITGVMRCDQPRMIDLTAPHTRNVDTLPASIMNEVLAKVSTLFK